MRDLSDSNLFSDQESDDDSEQAAVLVVVTSFLRHVDESEKGLPFTLPGFEPVVPHFWLTLARAAAAIATKEHQIDPEGGREIFDQAHAWIHKALHGSLDSGVFRGAAQILMEFGHRELARVEEKFSEAGVAQKLFEEAAFYLDQATKLGPAQPDILGDLAQSLMLQACWMEDEEQRTTLREAIRRCDEALACFTEENRRFADGGLHSGYTRLLAQAGVIRRLLASKVQDGEERRMLLEKALQQLSQAEKEGGLPIPEALR